MPIIIFIDVNPTNDFDCDNKNNAKPILLANECLKQLFEFLKINNKFETTCLVTFHPNFQIHFDFTNDYDLLKNQLPINFNSEKSNLLSALKCFCSCKTSLDNNLTYDFIILTDGIISSKSKESLKDISFLPNCKIHILYLKNLKLEKSLYTFKKIIMKNCKQKPSIIEVNTCYDGGQILIPDTSTFTIPIINDFFLKFCHDNFGSLNGKIICGKLSGLVTLSPKFSIDTIPLEFRTNLDKIKIIGFLNHDELLDAPIFSKHYIIPRSETNIEELKKWMAFIDFKSEMSDEEILQMFSDENFQPSFVVLLHGSFKIANMIALCEIGTSQKWYGILQSVSDKKKSNLMLYTFPPGLNSIPWITSFHNLTLMSALNDEDCLNKYSDINNNKSGKKTNNSYVWLRPTSLQADLQKIIRLTKKLPDKFDLLFSEINRIIRTAFATQFFDLISFLIKFYEIDVPQFPNYNNPETEGQIRQIISYLREPITKR